MGLKAVETRGESLVAVIDQVAGTDQPAGPIVVGCDGSEAGQPALDFAFGEAVMRGSSVRVVSAYSLPVSAFGYGMVLPDLGDADRVLKADTEQVVHKAVDAALAGLENPEALNVDIVVEQGRPAEVLLSAADDAALLVVGARGLGAWGRLLVGSTSTEVIHHAGVPVVVVPCHKHDSGHAHGHRAAESQEPAATAADAGSLAGGGAQ